MTATNVGDLLRAAAPAASVFTGGGVDGYEVCGLRPQAVVQVRSAEEVAATLRLAAEHAWAVAPRGGGTMLDLGNQPRRLDLVLDLSRMDAVIDYQPDDMTVTVQPGVTLAALDALLAERGQMLPLDAPLPRRATVGGTLAANVSGPRRLRFGTARDLVIGMQVATPTDGLARTGGRVVKNVAGYDLAKLHVGGLGTAGVITEVTFKLQPVPAGRGSLVAAFASCEAAQAAAMRILHTQLFPTALEVLSPSVAMKLAGTSRAEPSPEHWLLAVLLLGVPAVVSRQTREIMTLCTLAGSPVVTALELEHREPLFAGISDHGRDAADPAALIVRAALLPSETVRAARIVAEMGRPLGSEPDVIARPGAGLAVGYWRAVDERAVAEAVRTARASLAAFAGGLVVERAPRTVLPDIDVWGLSGDDLALMRQLKDVYDPTHVLNPGRFVAGL